MEADKHTPSGDVNDQSPSATPTAASSETMSEPVQRLLAYSQERASTNDVMRSLVSHHDWLVPVGFVVQSGEENRVLERMVILSSETQLPADELWVFTDQPSALMAQAKGAQLGVYAGGIAGTELFRKIPAGTKLVRVNPGSPTERTWMFQDGGGIEMGKIWADAIALEESFAQWKETGEPDRDAVSNYRAFMVFNHASGPIITLPNFSGMPNPAAAFTAPDCAEMFLSKLGAEQSAGMKQAVVDGKTLIEHAPRLGISGLMFNVFGPGATYAFPFDSQRTDEAQPSRILMLMLGDGLRLPSGFVADSPYRCLIYCKVPADWLEGETPASDELWLKGPSLRPDKIERLLEGMYGKTWRSGNTDGSQYVVEVGGARLLNPLRETERPWERDDPNDKRVRHFYFAAGHDGGFNPISPAEL